MTAERFRCNYTVSERGCWEWKGCRTDKGYGRANVPGFKDRLAHRIMAVMVTKKDIPEGLFVCHKCDNPVCVNPDHLFIGNAAANAQDMAAKGRGALSRARRFTEEEKDAMEAAFYNEGLTAVEVAARFGTRGSIVGDVLRARKYARR